MNPIKRRILVAVLGLGTLAGFASGFHSVHCHARQRHEAFERHVAAVCIDAAKHAD
jgi:hypothetical protein